jgi:hypothetical protein
LGHDSIPFALVILEIGFYFLPRLQSSSFRHPAGSLVCATMPIFFPIEVGVLLNCWWGWHGAVIILIFTSHIAKIVDISYWHIADGHS